MYELLLHLAFLGICLCAWHARGVDRTVSLWYSQGSVRSGEGSIQREEEDRELHQCSRVHSTSAEISSEDLPAESRSQWISKLRGCAWEGHGAGLCR